MLNKVTLIGNLGADPESRFMASGEQVVTLNVATTRRWKDKQSGERKEETEWHRVSIFGKLAEIASKYLKKGSKCYLEGRIKTSKYQKNGVDMYSTGIIADQMIMLDGKSDDSGAQPQQAQQVAYGQSPGGKFEPQTQYTKQTPHHEQKSNGYAPNQSVSEAPYDDDIPF